MVFKWNYDLFLKTFTIIDMDRATFIWGFTCSINNNIQ